MPTLVTRTRAARLAAAGLMAAAALAVTTPAATAATAAPVGTVTPVATATSAAQAVKAAPSGTKLWVTKRTLRLRWGASLDKNVAVIAYKDTAVFSLGKVRNGWVKVKVGGVKAWARPGNLTTENPGWDPFTVRVVGKDLGLRASWTNSSPVVVRATRGTKGIFTGVQKNGWWQIKIKGEYVWTPKRFVSINGTFNPTTILNVAHSQVGYREPAWRDNPYNDWIGGDNAWCSVFVSWVFDQANYKAGVPKEKHFDDYVAALRKAGVLDKTPTAGEIKKGDVVLIDWYPYHGPTHTGIVDHVSGSSIYLVEGNTTSGTGSTTRGVFYRQRAMVDVHASYRPSEYAFAVALANK